MLRRRRFARSRGGGGGAGCGYLLFSGLVASVLLLLNGALVAALYVHLAAAAPIVLGHPKAAQLIFYTLPVALALFQWWLLDALVDRLAGLTGRRPQLPGG